MLDIIYETGARIEKDFLSIGLDKEKLESARRLASLCMAEGLTPTEAASKQLSNLTQEIRGAFHTRR